MNPQLERLKTQRNEVLAEISALVAATEEGEGRGFTPEENTAYEAAKAKIPVLDTRIAAKQFELENELSQPTQPASVLDGLDTESTINPQPPNILKDPKRGFAHFGDFAASLAGAMTPGKAGDDRLNIMAAATGGSQGVGADGGFLVPPEFSNIIWDGLNKTPDNLLGMTDEYTVTGESLTFNANAETSRATGSRYGGIQGYWIAEADQITSSVPRFRQMKLEPQQLAVLVYETNKVLANAPALEQHLTRAATEEINFLVGDSIINGTGAGQPLGILTSDAPVSVAKEAGQSAATIVAANIWKMYARMHTRSIPNAVWLINQDAWPELFNLTIDVGTGGQALFVPPGGISVAPFGTLLGRPIMPIEYCSTLGTVGDIILADMKAYASGTRRGIESASSIHLRFDYAESVFRFMFEVDAQPWIASPLTPFKGSGNTVSPFVTLATRA